MSRASWPRVSGGLSGVAVVLALTACSCTKEPSVEVIAEPSAGADASRHVVAQAAAKQSEAERRAADSQADSLAKEGERPKQEASLGENADAAVSSRAVLPAGLLIGKPQELPIEGDRNLRVTHAAGNVRHAIIYLHGMCGDSKSADPWADQASAHGTLIVVRADIPCEDRPGYKWPKEPEAIQARIDAALQRVKQERGNVLDTEEVSLFGYSQGAHRAELLAGAYPERYPILFLGGPPTAPTVELLRHARFVAVLGGELEDSTHMRTGANDLSQAGIVAEFFLLPQAPHGSYGPEGRRVISRVLSFLYP